MPDTRVIWTIWLALVLLVAAVLATALTTSPAIFQSGQLTDGHHQYGVSCATCHGGAFEGTDVIESACRDCHEAALADADDSHPDRKFTDPRNASLVERLDARRCITCHTEHRPDRVRDAGLTLPKDLCIECHRDVVTERPTHRDASFDTCASAGCHNFHDNRALHEAFLERHLDEPPLLDSPIRLLDRTTPGGPALDRSDADGPTAADPDLIRDWAHSAHARGNVNCTDCHSSTGEWRDQVGQDECAECHEQEADGFLQGRHGMRATVASRPLAVGDARLEMKAEAAGRRPGCNECHGAHEYDTTRAAAESCLQCHDDEHSRNWRDSPHGQLWQAETEGGEPTGTGVACATCHMPRQENRDEITVEHNQNANLRPVETMARNVCMQCHGLRYAIESLADEDLIRQNFQGDPSERVQSFDWVRERQEDSE